MRNALIRSIPIFTVVTALCFLARGQAPSPTPLLAEDPATAAKSKPRFAAAKRWLELDALSVSTRYRFIESNAGFTANQNQWQFMVRARFKFDRDGKYSVYAASDTGNNLTAGWNNTGWGTGDPQPDLFVKELYFEAKPTKEVGVQAGGLGFNNGENTEIVGHDNDAYLMGERIRFRSPRHVYFDEVSITTGFVGDITRPNVFRRFKRLGEWNYLQTLVRKKVNNAISFSADYTYESGSDRFRQAVRFHIPRGNVLDTLLFENYQQLDPQLGYGFNVFGEKQFWKRVTVGGGFARIDQPMLNADRFPPGNRLYLNTGLRLTHGLTLQTAAIHAVGPLRSGALARTRVDVILTWSILELLKKSGVW